MSDLQEKQNKERKKETKQARNHATRKKDNSNKKLATWATVQKHGPANENLMRNL